jgi:hypothetical protein
MANHKREPVTGLTDADRAVLRGLITAEARRLNYHQYQHYSSYPARLRVLVRIMRKLRDPGDEF